MKQIIEIEVPNGKKAVWKDNKVIFEDILPKTWKEFCEQNRIKKPEYYLDASSCISETRNEKRYSSTDKNVLPSKQAAEAHLALMQLHQLRDCYRQGWIPNWENNSSKYGIKRCYNPLDYKTELRVVWYDHTHMFLTFPTLEMASEFLNNFKDLIEQAGDLI